MRRTFVALCLFGWFAATPAGAAIVTTEEFHAAPPDAASPLVLAPPIAAAPTRPAVVLDAALFNVVRRDARTHGLAVVPKAGRARPMSILQLGSAAVSQGAVYAHSMVGLLELLGTHAWRSPAEDFFVPDDAGEIAEAQPAHEAAAAESSEIAVSVYTILGATAFAASPFYLALGSMAVESLLAAPMAPMPPFAWFVAAGIIGVVWMGKRRRSPS